MIKKTPTAAVSLVKGVCHMMSYLGETGIGRRDRERTTEEKIEISVAVRGTYYV